tara:strand:- start:59 stop:691 length:633 start_codon:yes stop_codon:yes gene_type:complete
MPHQINHPFPSETQQDGEGAAIAGQVAGVASGLIDTSDPLAKNSIGKSAGQSALKGAALGANPALIAATGGLSVPIGAAVGGIVGAVKGKKLKEEGLVKVEIGKGVEASAEVDKNKYEMEQYDYSKINPDGTMATKYGVVKKLGAVTGTVANNMSVAQYKDEKKFSAIAKNMDEPIMNLGFIKAKTLEKDPNATTMVVDGETMPIKKLKY